jgi:hypothetical protein
MSMPEGEYVAMQQRVELISRILVDTDPDQLGAFIDQAERAEAIAPFVDPTAWMRGRDNLAMVIDHARAIRRARGDIVDAAERAGVPIGVTR